MKKFLREARDPRLLITMPWGIGDTISVGLSAVDQIMRNDPHRHTAIDILCNHLQSSVFAHDPRIHDVISVDDSLFPTAARGTWKRGLRLAPAAMDLARRLRQQGYTAVLPFFFAPSFFFVLHIPIIFLNVQESWDIFSTLRAFQDVSMQTIIRRIINKFFGTATAPRIDEPIPLYLSPTDLQKARHYAVREKAQAGLSSEHHPWMLVAPDTSSAITRPPTELLAQGLASALQANPYLAVGVLPGYTDTEAAFRLWSSLAPAFPDRISLIPAEPRMAPRELAAFIDQSDIFLTGDTSTMHLAVARKTLPPTASTDVLPRNTAKIITLFGGTHPGLHGYSRHSIIIGRGRKEQTALAPGIAKEMYHQEGKDFFDHISPDQITDAILS